MTLSAPFSTLKEAADNTDDMWSNRRSFSRENTGELAELIVDVTGRRIVCLVHNISNGGVMVESSATTLPKRVILNYKEKDTRRVCKVVWCKRNLAGLQFV